MSLPPCLEVSCVCLYLFSIFFKLDILMIGCYLFSYFTYLHLFVYSRHSIRYQSICARRCYDLTRKNSRSSGWYQCLFEIYRERSVVFKYLKIWPYRSHIALKTEKSAIWGKSHWLLTSTFFEIFSNGVVPKQGPWEGTII